MKGKLKTIGAVLLAAFAPGATAAIDAAANGEGHFISDGVSGHTIVKGFASPTHPQHLTLHKFPGEIGCKLLTWTHNVTTTTATAASVTLRPGYQECYTTPEPSPEKQVSITFNGCTITVKVAVKTTENTEQTVHLFCPPEKRIEIHDQNCTIEIDPQTITAGLTYTTATESGKHVLTVDTNVQFTHTEHGFCALFGTTGTGTLKGSVVVSGFDTEDKQVNITAT